MPLAAHLFFWLPFELFVLGLLLTPIERYFRPEVYHL